MPDGARIVVASPPDPLRSPQILPGTYFDCTAAGEADRWNCDVPATLLDLSVRGKGGYTPHYRWDVNVTSDGILDLGTVTLRKGASILAWLDSTFAKRVEQPVRASVRHRGAADLTPAAVRLATPVAEAVFTKAGFVQLGALAPGRYVLDVQSKGYAPIQIPVEVLEGRESVLKQTIELSRSASVTLRLLPPLGPEEAPWRVDLIRKTDFGTGSEPAGGGVASREGIFQAQEQAEGPLRVVVLDDKGNVYANREIDVPAGGGEQILALDVIAVTGTVKLGEEALPHASLLFGGSGGKERVNAVADGEGRFHAILPRRGEWRVDVEAAAEAVAATAEVSVGEDTKELEIELPSTEISGWVRGATGERSGSAEVMLLTGGRPMRRPSESDGTFRFRGVPAGEIRLSARDTKTGEYSGTVTTAVSEDAIKDGIELRIEGLNSVRGVVRSGGHPVIGARVIGFADTGIGSRDGPCCGCAWQHLPSVQNTGSPGSDRARYRCPRWRTVPSVAERRDTATSRLQQRSGDGTGSLRVGTGQWPQARSAHAEGARHGAGQISVLRRRPLHRRSARHRRPPGARGSRVKSLMREGEVMMNIVRLSLFAVVAILLFNAPDAFAIDNCQRCEGISSSQGFYVTCERPPVGELGARYCFIEYDPDYSFCHVEGNWCCVTGPAY
jgi:hypothetical protein